MIYHIIIQEFSEKNLRKECIDHVEKVLGLDILEELPHYDTINKLD